MSARWHFPKGADVRIARDKPNKKHSRISDAEFEDAYREALLCLADAGHFVGQPERAEGVRVCVVDGAALRDYEVLELWWGEEIAGQIRCARES